MINTLEHHPRSLRVFFITEMWERYGFYVVQSLLALYLALHFHWSDNNVYNLVSSFTALTYLSPVIGGFIADHLIGQKRAIATGAVILFFSYIGLSLTTSTLTILAALAGVSVGTGLLKPSISSLLGNEYALESTKRESGFTIFYMGLTLGIILGTTLPSYIKAQFGWPMAFLSAAIGMIISFIVFVIGVKRFSLHDFHPKSIKITEVLLSFLLMLSMWGLAFFILKNPAFANLAFGLIIVGTIFYLGFALYQDPKEQKKYTLIIIFLCLMSVIFWAFYFQMFLSITLMLVRIVQPTLFGINFPPPYYVTLQSLGMLVIGYILSRQHSQSRLSEKAMNTSYKFLLSIVFTSLSYGIIAFSCSYYAGAAFLSPLFFFPVYLLLSVAELLLSPVGLAAITVLANRHQVSTMMGIFFVSLGLGAFFAGKLAKLTSVSDPSLGLAELKAFYALGFTQMFYILLVASALCCVLIIIIRLLLKRESRCPC